MTACSISSEIPVLEEFISPECLLHEKYHTHDILVFAVKHNLVPVGMCRAWHISKEGDSPSSKDFVWKSIFDPVVEHASSVILFSILLWLSLFHYFRFQRFEVPGCKLAPQYTR
jgi:hypothetical protein